MTDLLHSPGFLGTNANFGADMTLILSILVALIFTVGFYIARQEKFVLHGRIQTVGALVNITLVLWLMILPFRDFVLRDQGGPRPTYFHTVTIFHALLGTAALLLGNFVVLRGHNLVPKALKFQNYKPFMRTAYTLYIVQTVLGIGVYLAWFVFVPNPPLFQ